MPKNGQFWRVLEKLETNGQTVLPDRPALKIQMRYFEQFSNNVCTYAPEDPEQMSRVNGKAASAKQSFCAAAPTDRTTATSSWQLTLYTFSIIFQHLLLPYLDSSCRSPAVPKSPSLIIALLALYLTNANGLPSKNSAFYGCTFLIVKLKRRNHWQV